MSFRDKILCEGFRGGRPCTADGVDAFEFVVSKDRVAWSARTQAPVYAFQVKHTALLCPWCWQQARLLRGANVQVLP